MPPENTPPAASLPPRSTRQRVLRWTLGTIGAVVAALVLFIVVLVNWDWNRAKPWVNDKVSEATGRTFSIDGDLSADWHWPQPLEEGWRRWVPGVTVRAQQLSLSNPEGFEVPEAPGKGTDQLPALPARPEPAAPAGDADAPTAAAAPASAGSAASDAARAVALEAGDTQANAPARPLTGMGTIASASATLRLLPLLSRTLLLDTVVLTAPDIVLARRQDGRNNWTFTRSHARESTAEDNPWDLRLNQLVVRGGWLGYADGLKDLALRARIDTLPTGAPQAEGKYGMKIALQGTYRKARITGEGLAGPVLSLRQQAARYPLRFSARSGSVQTRVEGVLNNPAKLSGMDLQVFVKAPSMADLYELTGLVLPNTPPFQVEGRLLGNLAPANAVWEYRDFNGTVGSSDLHGSLTYTGGEPRPKLQGHMTSKQLRLADLGPVLGAPSGVRAQEKGTSRRPGKVLPDARFATDRWGAMDLDLAFAGQKVVRPDSLPLDNLSVRAVLEDRQLRLTPLRFGVAHGRIDSNVLLDSRTDPLQVQLQGSVQGLQLSALFPKVERMQKSLGRLDGALALTGQGQSVARMLATSGGEVRLYIRDGTLSKELLDLAALNLGSVIVSKLFGDDKEVKLRCAVANLDVQGGVASTRTVKLNTEEAIVEAKGTVDLGDELLNLRITPDSLKWKFFSLRTPLYVRGTFADPQVGVEPGPLLLRAGAAVAAALTAPAALALLPITVPAAEDDAHCAALLAKAGAAPASAPAKPASRAQR